MAIFGIGCGWRASPFLNIGISFYLPHPQEHIKCALAHPSKQTQLKMPFSMLHHGIMMSCLRIFSLFILFSCVNAGKDRDVTVAPISPILDTFSPAFSPSAKPTTFPSANQPQLTPSSPTSPLKQGVLLDLPEMMFDLELSDAADQAMLDQAQIIIQDFITSFLTDRQAWLTAVDAEIDYEGNVLRATVSGQALFPQKQQVDVTKMLIIYFEFWGIPDLVEDMRDDDIPVTSLVVHLNGELIEPTRQASSKTSNNGLNQTLALVAGLTAALVMILCAGAILFWRRRRSSMTIAKNRTMESPESKTQQEAESPNFDIPVWRGDGPDVIARHSFRSDDISVLCDNTLADESLFTTDTALGPNRADESLFTTDTALGPNRADESLFTTDTALSPNRLDISNPSDEADATALDPNTESF
jgi:hypothetical protein